jgi:hypothetical protein
MAYSLHPLVSRLRGFTRYVSQTRRVETPPPESAIDNPVLDNITEDDVVLNEKSVLDEMTDTFTTEVSPEVFSRWLNVEKRLLDIAIANIYFFPYEGHINILQGLRHRAHKDGLKDTGENLIESQLNPQNDIDITKDCPICLCTAANPACSIKLPCCKQCMHPWCLHRSIVSGATRCPMCRSNICKITALMSSYDCGKWYFCRDLTNSLRETEDFFVYMLNNPTGFTPEYVIHHSSRQYLVIITCLEMLRDTHKEMYDAFLEKLEGTTYHIYVQQCCFTRLQYIFDALRDPTRKIHQHTKSNPPVSSQTSLCK